MPRSGRRDRHLCREDHDRGAQARSRVAGGPSGSARTAPAETVAPARRCAFTVVRRVFEQGAYADRALRSEAAALAPRDRALATQLAYGTVQRRLTLDHVASQLSSRAL